METLESLHWFLDKPKSKTLIPEFSFANFIYWIRYSYIPGFPFSCWIIFFILKYYVFVFVPKYMHYLCASAHGGQKRPRDCNYSIYEMPDVSVGTEPRSSAIDVCTFNHWTTSQSFRSQCILVLQVFICCMSLKKTFANV